ncbi:MAG: hypothetical protein V5A68_07455 [Candidatus Thermoplasmatota archaeon]
MRDHTLYVNHVIDKIIDKHQKKDEKEEEIPPFRYLKNEEEISDILEQNTGFSIKTDRLPQAVKMVEGKSCLAGLGDTDTIENVIKKHIKTRKFKD